MASMKELFSDVLQQVMEAELEEKLGYEKSDRTSDCDETGMSKNYRNGYSKKTVKTQLGEVDVKIPVTEMVNMIRKLLKNTAEMLTEWEKKFLHFMHAE